MSSEENILGGIYESKNSGNFIVTKKLPKSKYEVEFLETGYKTTASAWSVKVGCVKDKLNPSIYGVAFIGDGDFSYSKDKEAYKRWFGPLSRCYSGSKKCYEESTFSDEWLNFQNFAAWFYSRKEYDKSLQLDKDIAIIGNKQYSAEACNFVPGYLNNIVNSTTSPKHLYSDLPIGVTLHKEGQNSRRKQSYMAQKSGFLDSKRFVGYSESAMEAHFMWMKAKAQELQTALNFYVQGTYVEDVCRGVEERIEILNVHLSEGKEFKGYKNG